MDLVALLALGDWETAAHLVHGSRTDRRWRGAAPDGEAE